MRILFGVFLLFTQAAFAADSRKIDFTAILTDADNQPIYECANPGPSIPANDPACKDKRPFTLGLAAERALIQPEQNLSPEDSLMRGQLALNVLNSSGAELKAEEIALIKKRIAALYGPLIVARAFPLLDPAAGK